MIDDVIDFGLADYQAVLAWQERLVTERLAGAIQDTLLVGEHPPVITLGRGTDSVRAGLNDGDGLLPAIPVVAVSRGGGATCHMPGQLVGYPIVWLPPGQRDLHGFLRTLESRLIEVLGYFGLQGYRRPGYTGVWVDSQSRQKPQKIAAMGVAVKRWVTYHGFSLNITNSLADFSRIRPCGLDAESVTSMAEQLGPVDSAAVRRAVVRAFSQAPLASKVLSSAGTG